MIKRTIIAIAAVAILLTLAVLSGAVRAGEITTMTFSRGQITVTQGYADANPRIIHVPADHSAAGEARAKRWLEFCKPKPIRGQYGVIYLRYAHAGCEYGRDH